MIEIRIMWVGSKITALSRKYIQVLLSVSLVIILTEATHLPLLLLFNMLLYLFNLILLTWFFLFVMLRVETLLINKINFTIWKFNIFWIDLVDFSFESIKSKTQIHDLLINFVSICETESLIIMILGKLRICY